MEALPEVAVADADEATMSIYQRIMRRSGTGTPALIFRHFAVFPGFLDWVWQAVGDEVESGQVLLQSLDAVARARALDLPPVSDADLARAGVDADGRLLLGAIFANYNRMNPMNYGLIAAIRELIARPGSRPAESTTVKESFARMPTPCPTLPPPVVVREMPADLQQTMSTLSAGIPAPGARVVPTLYRHLAIWPDFVRLIAPGLLAALEKGDVTARMHDLGTEMRPLTNDIWMRASERNLPRPPLDAPEAMVRTLDSFLIAIPQMIVVGAALEAAMPRSVPSWRGGA